MITVTGTADNTDFTFAVTSATSKTYPAGVYRWIQYVILTAGGSERYTVASGIVELLPDLATVQGGYDSRSHAQRMVDLLEASIEKLATDAIQELEIAGRRYVKADIATLRSMLNQYRNEVDEATSGKRRKILYAFRPTT